MLKFGEEWMKITHSICICHFLIKTVLKISIFDQKGGQKSKFRKIQKIPLDILEIHVVSKFGPI